MKTTDTSVRSMGRVMATELSQEEVESVAGAHRCGRDEQTSDGLLTCELIEGLGLFADFIPGFPFGY